jgi:hypothetical protein
MSKANDGGFSLTLKHIEDFIKSADNPPKRQLIAPNWEIAQQWSKQYPGYDILVSAKHVPKKDKL